MGESGKQGFQLSFNRFLRVGFQGSRVTSNGGLILVRELDERLGFSELIDEHLTDSRANNARFSFADLLRQSVYSRLAGYEDVNDAEQLSQDPTFRLIGSEKTWERGAALTSRLQTFETEMLAKVENFVGLARINRELIGKVEAFQWHYRAVLDMDSTEIPVYGEQEQSAYNGHFESTCYHPLLLFNRDGDCLAAKLRPGNVHSAEGWERVAAAGGRAPATDGERNCVSGRCCLCQAGDLRSVGGAGCEVCHPDSGQRKPAAGHRGVAETSGGQAQQETASRVQGLSVPSRELEDGPTGGSQGRTSSGELFPRVGFIVTNLTLPSRAVVRFYNKRGTTEQWIKEGKQAVKMTRLSCHRFRSNEVRLWLTIIAYNLGNLWRRLVLPQRIGNWSLTSLQQRLVKTGGRLVKHARYYWLLLAEGHLSRRLFASMLRMIAVLPLPDG